MFQMPVVEVPTNLPNIRIDLPIQAFAVRLQRIFNDFIIFADRHDRIKFIMWYGLILSQTVRGKWEYVREEVESMFQLGRPVLVGTTR